MNKDKCIGEYRRIFKDTSFKKVVPFRSPNDGNVFKLERVNPDHVGIIWGKTKRSPSCFVRFAKVYFIVFPVTYGLMVSSWLDFYTMYVFNILSSIGILTLFLSFMVAVLYYFPLYLNIKTGCVFGC